MASETPDDLVSRRSKELMGVVTMDDSRARREQTTIKLRKKKREESRAKRRANHTAGQTAAGTAGSLAPAPLTPAEKLQQQQQLQVMAQDPAAIRQLLVNMQSADDSLRLSAITHVRKLLSIEVNPPIQQVIDVGMIPVMVGLLQVSTVPKLQFEAAWALTNVASGNSTQTRCVVESGAIQHLVNLIMSAHDDVREQSIWALGNIAGDGPVYRNIVISAGIIPPLLSVMTPKARKPLLRNGTWTISNLCRGKPSASFQQVRHCLPVLAQMVNMDDKEVLTDACWALSYLSDGSNEKVQAVVTSGVTKRLVQLMSHEALSVQTPALRTIGNIVAGDDVQTDAVVAAGAIGKLAALLTSDRRTIRKEAAWAMSNITAGSADQVAAVVRHGVLSNVVHCMQHDDFEIRKECVWCVCNASHGGSAQDIMAIAAAGAIPALIGLLGVPDSRVVIVSLETLENILRVGEQFGDENGVVNPYVEVVELHDGVESLERLQHHVETNIFVKAKELLTQYLDAQPADEDDESAFPSTASDGTLAFGQGGGGLGAPLQLGNLGAPGAGGLMGVGMAPPPVPQAGLMGMQQGVQPPQPGLVGGIGGVGQGPATGGLMGAGLGQPQPAGGLLAGGMGGQVPAAGGGALGAQGGLFAPTSGGLGLQ